MTYGTIKIDTITFTDGGVDKSVSISGLVQNPTFSGDITVTGTVSGNTIRGQTVSGVTVTGTTALFSTGTFISLTGTTSQGTTATYTSGSFTSLTGVTTSGTTANFVSGVFSTQISGATVTGNAGAFTTLTGGVTTVTSGVFAVGSESNPSISFTSDPNTGIYSPGADQVAISTNSTQRLLIDASGNVNIDSNTFYVDAINNRVAIGTTSPRQALTFGGLTSSSTSTPDCIDLGATYTSTSASTNLKFKLYVDSSGNTYGFTVNGSSHLEYYAGTVGSPGNHVFLTGGSERARIESSGRLLVGTSSGKTVGAGQYSLLNVQGYVGASNGGGDVTLSRGETAANITTGEVLGLISFTDSAGYAFGQFYCEADGTAGTNDYPGRLVFSTTADGASSPTERMRIGANGYIRASNTGSYYSTGTFHELDSDSATDASLLVGSFNTSKNHGNTSACLVVADYDSDYTDSNLFGGWNVTNNSWRILIRGDGDVENVNNSYGALSDVKLKENIVNAGSQWDDIKALQVRKYNFKEGQTHTQIGLIAQEVELVSPGLVSESPDRDEDGNALGTVTKSVNYSVLYMKAVKALQEAMERIETLEAKVAALEA